MSDSLAYALARAIRAERARAGLSQGELADKLGWSRQVVTAVETGARGVYAHELPELCAALGVGLRRLLTDANAADLEKLKL